MGILFGLKLGLDTPKTWLARICMPRIKTVYSCFLPLQIGTGKFPVLDIGEPTTVKAVGSTGSNLY